MDNTNPEVTPNSVGYSRSINYATNGDEIILNSTVTDANSGIYDVVANTSLLGGSSSLSMIKDGGTDNYDVNVILTGITTDGIKNIIITAKDNAWNLNNTEAIAVTVDVTPPQITIIEPSNLEVINKIMLLNTTIQDVTSGINNSNATINGNNITDFSCVGIICTGTYNTSLLVDGDGYINVTSMDNIDNIWIESLVVNIDNTPPEVTITKPTNYEILGGNYTYNVTILDVQGNGNTTAYKYAVMNDSETIINWSTLSGSGSIWGIVIDTMQYGDGNYTFFVRANDTANNMNDTESVNYTVDNKPPQITIHTPTEAEIISGIYRLNTTIIDFGGNGDTDTYNYSIDNMVSWNPFDANITNDYYVDMNTSNIFTDGENDIFVRANDTLGNSRIKTVSFVVDNTPPEVIINTPTDLEIINKQYLLNVTIYDLGNHENISTYEYRIDANLWLPFDSNTSIYWFKTLNTTNMTEGNHQITATANDTENNQNIVSINVSIDNLPPEVNIINPYNNSWIYGLQYFNITLNDTGNHGDNTTYEYLFENTTILIPWSGLLSAGTDWHITLNTTKYRDGIYTFSVRANDTVDNANETEWINVILDNNAPNVTITTPLNNSLVNHVSWLNATIVDEGENGINTTYKFRIHNGTDVISWTQLNGSGTAYYASVNMSLFADGNYTFEVSANDTFNQQGNDSVVITYDATHPTINITYPQMNDNFRTPNGTLWINGTIVDMHKVSNDPIVNNTNFTLFYYNNTTGEFAFNNTLLGDDNYSVNISFVDDAGNLNYAVSNFVLDNTPPQVWGLYTPDAPGGLVAVVTNPLKFRVNINESYIDTAILTVPSASTNTSNMTFEFSFSGGVTYNTTRTSVYFNMTNGTYTMYANVTDIAGNTNHTTYEMTIDDNAPILVPPYNITPLNVEVNYENVTVDLYALDAGIVEWVRVNFTHQSGASFEYNMTRITGNYQDSNGTFGFNFTPTLSGVYDVLAYTFDTENIGPYIPVGTFTAIGITNGLLLQTPIETILYDNITQNYSAKFILNVTLNNTGPITMYNAEIGSLAGVPNIITNISGSNPSCGGLSIGENCTHQIEINITANTPPKNYYSLVASGIWEHPDYSGGVVSNSTKVRVGSNPVLLTEQDSINGLEVFVGETKEAGYFTVYSFGNSDLLNVTFNVSGGNITEIQSAYAPNNISVLGQGNKLNVSINLTLSSRGPHQTTIVANATGSVCTSAENCVDNLTINTTAFDYSQITLFGPAQGTYNRSDLNIICQVTNKSDSAGISGYNASYYDFSEIDNTTSQIIQITTNETGFYDTLWNATNVSVGPHTLLCNIIDDISNYYYASSQNKSSEVNLTLMGALNLSVIRTVNPTELYWYDSSTKNSTTFTATVKDEMLNNIEGAFVNYYSNATLALSWQNIGNCTTDASGTCDFAWNPSVEQPGLFSVKYNATKSAYYYNTSTIEQTANISGGVSADINMPLNGTDMVVNNSYILNASIWSDGLDVTPSITDINWTLLSDSLLIGNKTNDTWFIPQDISLGSRSILVEVANGTGVTTKDTVNITIVDYAFAELTYLSGNQYPRKDSSVNMTAKISKTNGSVIEGYSCDWINNGVIMETTYTNSMGYCNYTWQTTELDSVGNHTVGINISDVRNASVGYYIPYSSNFTDTETVTLTETLLANINFPVSLDKLYRGDKYTLNATTKNAYGTEIENTTLNWTLTNLSAIEPVGVYNFSIREIQNSTFNWTVDNNHTRGEYILNLTVSKDDYVSNSISVNISIYSWTIPTIVLPENGSTVTRSSNVNMSCQVREKYTGATLFKTISSYAGNVTIVGDSNSTACNGSCIFSASEGYLNFTWDADFYELGVYNITCIPEAENTAHHITAYNNTTSQVTLTDTIIISQFTITPNIVYRDTDYMYAYKDVTNLTVSNVMAGSGLSLEDANIDFFINNTIDTFIGNCTINTGGNCTFVWNPDKNISKGLYIINAVASKEYFVNETKNESVSLFAHAEPVWSSPKGSIEYNESSYPYIDMKCKIEETYPKTPIENYAVTVWVGSTEKPKLLEDMNDVSDWLFSGNGSADSTDGLTTLTAVLGNYSRMNPAKTYTTKYHLISVDVVNLTEDAVWSLGLSNGTDTISYTTNRKGIVNFNITDFVLANQSFENISITIHDTTALNESITIDSIILLDTTLENAKEVAETIPIDDMENLDFTCSGLGACWKSSSVNAILGSETNYTFRKEGIYSLRANITTMAPGATYYIYRNYWSYSAAIWLNQRKLSFWIYVPETLTELDTTLDFYNGALPTLCSSIDILSNFTTGWNHRAVDLENENVTTDCPQLKRYGIKLNNTGTNTTSGAVYIDDFGFYKNSKTDTTGEAIIKWRPFEFDNVTVNCGIVNDAGKYYVAYPKETYEYITLVDISSGAAQGNESGGDDEEPEYTSGENVTTFNVTPEYIYKATIINNHGSMAPITITNRLSSQSIFINTTIGGSGASYISILNETGIDVTGGQIEIPASSTRTVTPRYNTLTNEGLFTAVVYFTNGEISEQLNTTIDFDIIEMSVAIMNPVEAVPAINVTENDTLLNVDVDASYDNSPAGSSSGITWDIYVDDILCDEVNSTYIGGFTWKHTCALPKIPGNPISNALKIRIEHTNGYAEDTENNAVFYQDVTGPVVIETNATSAALGETVNIISNITDNTNVSAAIVVITYNETGVVFENTTMDNIGGLYEFNFTNTTLEGDYDIIIYTNDSLGHTTESYSWFDIYPEIFFEGNITTTALPVRANFSLYRPGTPKELISFNSNSTGIEYNAAIRNRTYDLGVILYLPEMLNQTIIDRHEITFMDADLKAAEKIAGKLINPLVFDSVPLTELDLPSTTKGYGIAGVSINSTFGITSVILSLDYTNNLNNLISNGENVDEDQLYVYKCSKFSAIDCTSGDWVQLTGIRDKANNIITATSATTSTYIVSEYIGSGNTGTGGGDDNTVGGSSGGALGFSGFCGDNICDITEDAISCPEDCIVKIAEFTLKTTLSEAKLMPGETQEFELWVTNKKNESIVLDLSASGAISPFISFVDEKLSLAPVSTNKTSIIVSVTNNTEFGTYSGRIIASSMGISTEAYVMVLVGNSEKPLVDIQVDALTYEVDENGTAKFAISVQNLAFNNMNLTYKYAIYDSKTSQVVYEREEIKELWHTDTFIYSVPIMESNITEGDYYLKVQVLYKDGISEGIVTRTAAFKVVNPFWSEEKKKNALFALIALLLIAGAAYSYFWYEKQKKLKARYVFPTDFSKLPGKADDAFWLGNIADTKKRSFFDPKDLVTHALVAGSTGAGKSVAASIFAEEALKKKIPVIVFDPTSQWTGFVKPCRDKNLIVNYPEFGLTSDSPRQFNGLLFNVTTSNISIDLKKYMNPGEITVFNMARLESAEYDIAVQKIIQKIFEQSWEESPTLRLLVVFDEVHRLLDKYGGGKGGYVAMEKACREFRKWGIGLIMVSQVNADFKSAVQGNILTEVQLNTKNMEDITKAETKYGSDYARRITRQAIGVGMLQNPKYNDGKPWFVSFRPTLHDPHKITDEELVKYDEYARKLETIEARIADIKKRGTDTSDKDIELKLAKDKLKQGRFKMAEIYIDSLENWLEKNK